MGYRIEEEAKEIKEELVSQYLKNDNDDATFPDGAVPAAIRSARRMRAAIVEHIRKYASELFDNYMEFDAKTWRLLADELENFGEGKEEKDDRDE